MKCLNCKEEGSHLDFENGEYSCSNPSIPASEAIIDVKLVENKKDAKKTIILTSSSANSVQNCPQRYDYEINQQLCLPNKGVALEKGDLFHFFLENYYKGLLVNNTTLQYIDKKIPTHEIVNMAILKVREKSVNSHLESVDTEEVIQFAREYVQHYVNDGWTPIAVEEKFSVVIYEDDNFRIIAEGKVDLVANTAQQNINLVVDHKTGKRNVQPSKLSTQFQLYALALNYNNVMVNKINWVKDPSNRFHRYLLSYDKTLIEEFKQDLIYWAFEIIKHTESNYFPRNRTSCDKYSGCPFKLLCESIPDVRQLKIDQFYVKNESYHLFTED